MTIAPSSEEIEGGRAAYDSEEENPRVVPLSERTRRQVHLRPPVVNAVSANTGSENVYQFDTEDVTTYLMFGKHKTFISIGHEPICEIGDKIEFADFRQNNHSREEPKYPDGKPKMNFEKFPLKKSDGRPKMNSQPTAYYMSKTGSSKRICTEKISVPEGHKIGRIKFSDLQKPDGKPTEQNSTSTVLIPERTATLIPERTAPPQEERENSRKRKEMNSPTGEVPGVDVNAKESIGSKAPSAPKPEINEMKNINKAIDFIEKESMIKKLVRVNTTLPLPEPTTYKEAMKTPQAENWKREMQLEIDAANANDTWELCQLPPGRKAMKCKWVFKNKFEHGALKRQRARIVGKGFSQIYGVDYEETFAPVISFPTLRTLLAIAAQEKKYCKHADIGNAYLKSEIEEHFKIYMEQPEGFEQVGPKGEKMVLRLKKSLYGLKQAGRRWNILLNDMLLSWGFVKSSTDPCLYSRRNGDEWVHLAIWVDDIFAVCSDSCITTRGESKLWDELVENLVKAFEKVTNNGNLSWALGLEFLQQEQGISITCDQYIDKLIEKFGLQHAHSVETPLGATPDLTKVPVPEPGSDEYYENQNLPYRQIIGSLIYASVTCRPDISYATNLLSRWTANPSKKHFEAAKRVVRYLKGTKKKGLFYTSSAERPYRFTVPIDAAYADDNETRRSTSGLLIYLGANLIHWKSTRQPVVAMSSSEAEYIALCLGVRETYCLRGVTRDCVTIEAIPEEDRALHVLQDNQASITIAEEPALRKNSKGWDVRWHWVQEQKANEEITITWVPTKEMLADGLTKALGPGLFKPFQQNVIA